MAELRKYGTVLSADAAGSEYVRVSIRKAGSADYATDSDWTPVAGDVKVSLDGGTQNNIGTLPAYSNGSWEFTLSGAELTAKSVRVIVVDSATKAVDDCDITVETFGHASAKYPATYQLPFTRAIPVNPTLTVSLYNGTPSPSPVGTYSLFGWVNGLACFSCTADGETWYLWNQGGSWLITKAADIGDGTANPRWQSTGKDIEDVYTSGDALSSVSIAMAGSQFSAPVVENAVPQVLAVRAKTDNLPTDPADESLLEAAIAAASAPSAASVAGAVWNESTSGHATAGTFGARLDATISSRATPADVSAGNGDGDTLVNQNTGGTDALRVLYNGIGVDNATLRAYLKTDYDAGTYTVRASDVTGPDGRWINGMYLTAGSSYKLTVEKQGVFAATVKTLTWNSGTGTWVVS